MGPETMQNICNYDFEQSNHVTAHSTAHFKRLTDARATVASLVVDNPIYIPIFERIELELATLDAECSTVSRARLIAARRQIALA